MKSEMLLENGVRLAFSRFGKGRSLVLIHGYPLDHSIWLDLVPLLEDRFDLILPDLRGFGGSTAPSTAYSINEMASDLAGLLDRLGIEQASLAGHSMGGYVALAYARQYPGRVRGIGLVASQAAADPPDRKTARYETAALVRREGPRAVVEAMAEKLTADERVRERIRGIMLRQGAAGIAGALEAMAQRDDSTEWLTSNEIDLVLIHGSADVLIPIQRAQEIKSLGPQAVLRVLDGAGHMPMLENAVETAAALGLLK